MPQAPSSMFRVPAIVQLAEPRPDYRDVAPPGFSEADLSSVWEGQTFPPEAMTARDGKRLRVVYRGRRGHGPGPDFRDAIIAAPYGLLEGDVELHLRASDFRRHGHHLDPAYDNVALHLVLENDDGADTVLSSGRRAPVVALGDWLAARAEQMRRWLERPPLWQEPCRDSLARRGLEDVGRTLDRLGDMRFRAAAAVYGKRLAGGEDADELAWRGLLEALGYGGERGRFRSLAEAVPWRSLRALTIESSVAQARVLALQALLAADGGGEQRRGSLRPANRFEKRLEGAAVYAVRWPDGMTRRFSPLLNLEGRKAVREIVRLLTVPGVVGRSRALEMAANVILPLLAALEGGVYERQAERLYALLPLPAHYGVVRHLHEAVGGSKENGTWNREHRTGNLERGTGGKNGSRGNDTGIAVNARRQQGMLYLLKQYCTQGGCGRCPLS